MKLKKRPLLLVIGILILAGGLFLFVKKRTVLQVRNLDHSQTLRISTGPSGAFSIFYINSIYNEPVSEEFQIKGDSIFLKGVRTKSPGVMGYYGFDDTRELHPMNRNLGAAFIFKKGMVEGQGLRIGEKKIFLNEIGEKGDSIQLSAEFMRLGHYIFLMLFNN
ncbi:MAG: hypothetical protein EHM85_03295 [Desulfobacteraceae bacterium]|nr:MAG: hypothetical protein EHM85_03295 [Desulfobacteraceae bacterium]